MLKVYAFVQWGKKECWYNFSKWTYFVSADEWLSNPF